MTLNEPDSSGAVDKTTGLRFDQSVALDGFYSRQDYPQHLRRVCFVDPETGKRLIFLTNHFALPALTIAALYKRRWQVELTNIIYSIRGVASSKV
jgi:hypothetical protein